MAILSGIGSESLFVEHVGIPAGAEPIHLRIEDLDDYGSGQAIKADRPRLIHDIEKEGLREGEWEALRRFGTRSYITLPFHIRLRVAGMLGVASPIPDHFDDLDIERLDLVVRILGLKLAELGFRAPHDLGPRSSVLPSRVDIIGDAALCLHVSRILPPEIETELSVGSLEAVMDQRRSSALTICCCPKLDMADAERIHRALRRRSRRLVVICREASPGCVSFLVSRSHRDGLVTIESDDLTSEDLCHRLARWCFGDTVRPDWKSLGLNYDRSDHRLEQVIRDLEREPLRNWRVKDLAREAAMSQATLNRSIRRATGASTKSARVVSDPEAKALE